MPSETATSVRNALGEEALDAEQGAELRIENLESDTPLVLQVVREEDGRHAAPQAIAWSVKKGRVPIEQRQCA